MDRGERFRRVVAIIDSGIVELIVEKNQKEEIIQVND